MTIKIRDELPKDVKIAALSTGNSYYLNQPFYCPGPATLAVAWIQDSSQYPDPQDFYNKLINFGITHVFINDHVVEQWGLENSWINQSEFKERYLDVMLKVDGQFLYKIKSIKNIKER